MSGAKYFFILFYALVAVIGLVTLGLAHDYLQFFGFALLVFGSISAFMTTKRHFDEAEKH
jgi:threonine/homoserine/homoserine lactone efflux protein